MTRYQLIAHPDAPPNGVRSVQVDVVAENGTELLLTFIVEGSGHVALPDWVTSVRADDLWKTTCCELFLASADGSYVEFNYSPSTCWAAYRFERYRTGRSDLKLPGPPHVDRGDEDSPFLVQVDQGLTALPAGPLAMGLSAVIEEVDGTKSYWALAHAAGPPDFHNRDCFTATLAAPRHP